MNMDKEIVPKIDGMVSADPDILIGNVCAPLSIIDVSKAIPPEITSYFIIN